MMVPHLHLDDHPGVENAIAEYFQCERCCLEGLELDLSAGITVDGDLQFWCENHGINVALLELPWGIEPMEAHERPGDAH